MGVINEAFCDEKTLDCSRTTIPFLLIFSRVAPDEKKA